MCEKFLIAADFHTDETEPCLSKFLSNYDSNNLVKDKTCFENSGSFQNTTTVVNGSSDVHKMIVTVCKYSFQKPKAKEIVYRDYKNFDINTFKNFWRLKLENIKNYQPLEQVFLETLNEYAPLKKTFLRANHVPYMTKSLLKAIMSRILKIELLKIKLNISSKRNIVKYFIKKNRKIFTII